MPAVSRGGRRPDEGRPPGAAAAAPAESSEGKRLAASAVLDAHRALRDSMNDPYVREVMDDFMVTAIAEDEVKALQTFWPAGSPAEFTGLLRDDLTPARTFQVAAGMVGEISGEAGSGQDTIRLTEAELPCPAGFAWLDKPVAVTGAGEPRVTARAFSWAPQIVPDTGRREILPGVRIAAWHGAADCDDLWDPGMRDGWLRATGGRYRLIFLYARVVPFGFDIPGAHRTLSWVQALWGKLGSEVAVQETPGIKKHSRKKFARSMTAPPEVVVVSLRRPAQPAGRDGGAGRAPGAVNWRWQWPVREHHRHLEAYDVPAHEAMPSQKDAQVCATCSKRITKIPRHVKGPPGRTLKPPAGRVHRLHR